jgi:GT2 family glycosyltransferase
MEKLTLGYSTMAHRVGDIVTPPMRKDWGVSIVIQNPEGIAWRGERLAQLMLREDVEIEELSTLGVAKSRNRNIWLAKGEYLIFADDDIEFQIDGLIQALDYLDNHPEFSLLLGMATDTSGALRKQYPQRIQKLTKFNSARAATYEMIIRVDAIRQFGVWFDEEFGAGAKNYLGDEYIFIVDLLAAGGKAVFVPIVLAKHPVESSGSRWGSEKDRRARAAVFTRVFGWLAPLVRLVFGLRRYKELGSLGALVLFVLARK